MDDAPVNVLVCGGGNAAHTICGLASSRKNVNCRVLTLFMDEAERWTNLLGDRDFVVDSTKSDGSVEVINSKPNKITNNPNGVVSDSDLVIFAVPAFAHEEYFNAIAPFLKPNTIVAGMPSQPGFEFQYVDLLKEKAEQVAVVCFETLPWACRIEEFGKRAKIIGTKDYLGCSVIMQKSKPKFEPIQAMQRLFGSLPVIYKFNNYLSPNLIAHPVHNAIMYGAWGDWDGKPLDEEPLFYQGLSERSADLLSKIADEMMLTAKIIMEKAPYVDLTDVIHVIDWYRTNYKDYITDFSNLRSMIRSNKAYEGLLHPMVKTSDGKFVPDFKHRYFTEDTPFIIVVIKGICACAGVDTPVMDETVKWCQEKIGKEYIVGSELNGKDLIDTRAPQRYGFKSLDDLLKLL